MTERVRRRIGTWALAGIAVLGLSVRGEAQPSPPESVPRGLVITVRTVTAMSPGGTEATDAFRRVVNAVAPLIDSVVGGPAVGGRVDGFDEIGSPTPVAYQPSYVTGKEPLLGLPPEPDAMPKARGDVDTGFGTTIETKSRLRPTNDIVRILGFTARRHDYAYRVLLHPRGEAREAPTIVLDTRGEAWIATDSAASADPNLAMLLGGFGRCYARVEVDGSGLLLATTEWTSVDVERAGHPSAGPPLIEGYASSRIVDIAIRRVEDRPPNDVEPGDTQHHCRMMRARPWLIRLGSR